MTILRVSIAHGKGETIATYLGNKEDHNHDNDGDDKEKTDWDLPRWVASQFAGALANGVDNERTELNRSMSVLVHGRKGKGAELYHQTELVRADSESSNLARHDLGLVDWHNCELHADIDVFQRPQNVSLVPI